MCRVRPSRFALLSAPMLSAIGTCGFGQWISRRSTTGTSSSFRLLSSGEIVGLQIVVAHLGGEEDVFARHAGGADRQPDLALVAIERRSVDVAIALPDRGLDRLCASV